MEAIRTFEDGLFELLARQDFGVQGFHVGYLKQN